MYDLETLNRTEGELADLSPTTELCADVVFMALLDMHRDDIKRFAKMPKSVNLDAILPQLYGERGLDIVIHGILLFCVFFRQKNLGYRGKITQENCTGMTVQNLDGFDLNSYPSCIMALVH